MSSHVIRMAAIAGLTALTVSTAASCSGGAGGPEVASEPAAAAEPRPADDAEHEEAHWGYEGAEGPSHWASLSEDFAKCGTGREQSPIDLAEDGAVEAPADAAVAFDYGTVTASLVNDGHTVRADVSEGSGIVLDGTSYDLVQFHFHLPSEHTGDGAHTAMEMHFVHEDRDGRLAVVGVLMDEERGDSAFAELFGELPAEEGGTAEFAEPLDLAAFLPGDRDQYRYEGSLTTPPCTEGVAWTVLKDPVEVAPDEVAAYRKLFRKNNRPTRPLNDRTLTLAED